MISVTVSSLDQLILLVHSHGQQCPSTPRLQPDLCRQEVKERPLAEDPETFTRLSETTELHLRYVCEGRHTFTWCPIHTQRDDDGEMSERGSAAASGIRERQRKGTKQDKVFRTRSARKRSVDDGFGQSNETERVASSASGENEEAGKPQDTRYLSCFIFLSL